MAIGAPNPHPRHPAKGARGAAAGRAGPPPAAIQRRLEAALGRHRAGDFAGAQALYDEVLRERPDQSDALHMLGVLRHQQGDSEGAVALIRKALEGDPQNASCYINLGAALLKLGRRDEADATLAEAVRRLPNSPEAHANLAALKEAAGELPAAIEHLERALALQPTNAGYRRRLAEAAYGVGDFAVAAEAYREFLAVTPDDIAARNDFGVSLEKLERYDAAAEQYGRVVEQAPDLAEGHANLANALARIGQLAEAEYHHRRALELKPTEWRFELNLAGLLWETGRLDEAEALFRKNLDRHPDDANLWHDYGSRLTLARRFDAAREALERAVALDSGLATAHNGLGNVLGNIGDYAGAIAAYERAVAVDPNFLLAQINLAMTLQQERRFDEAAMRAYGLRLLETYSPKLCDGRILQILKVVCDFDGIESLGDIWQAAFDKESHIVSQMLLTLLALADDEPKLRSLSALTCKLGAEEEAKCKRSSLPAPTPRRHAGPIRIGFVSSDFRNHSAANCLRPLFRNYDRDRFAIHCYSALPAADDQVQRELAAQVDSFTPIDGMTDLEAARKIRGDAVDLLFDLNGWTAHSRLSVFGHRPAPRQVAWLGWPFTTGFRTMDHFLVDRFNEPTLPELMTERPLRIEGPWVAFQPMTQEPVGEPPALAAGHVTFGTLNNTYKITRPMVAIWAAVLARLPGSRFFLARPEARSFMLVNNLLSEFAKHGIAADRIDLVGQARDTYTHFPFYRHIDVALDSFPVTGGITTCDSLWMGVPVVSLHGPAFHERIGHSLLNHAGLGELSHATADGFIDCAVRLAGDPDRLAELRAGLRSRLLASPLFDGEAFTRNFAAAVESLVAND
jgi:protein O-GlcNAc transferase